MIIFRRLAVVAVLPAFIGACSTIHFDHGAEVPGGSPEVSEQWHHNALFQLIEVSDAVTLAEQCAGGEWVRITTELTFVGALAHNLTQGLWTPWTVRYAC